MHRYDTIGRILCYNYVTRLNYFNYENLYCHLYIIDVAVFAMAH